MITLANAAARLKAKSAKPSRYRWPTLWLMTDAVRLPNPLAAVASLPRGSGVIVRHPESKTRERLGRAIVRLCRQRRLICLIAADWRLAARLRADGVHLPEAMARFGIGAPVHLWRRQSQCILTIATHGATSLRRGVALKPDAFVLAPVFATASHPEKRPLGSLQFARLANTVKRPIIALGGINPQNAARLMLTKVSGIAAVGALAAAPD